MLAQELISGNRRALARGISIVEQGGAPARELLAGICHGSGGVHIVGVTGAPGAGKSTLVNAMAREWRRRGKSVGILAVDPSSPFTGGAILGDRIRMQPLGGDAGVFVRSMASRGRLGGIARATGDAIRLLDAAGFEIVLVETVGAGQGEVEIAGEAHTVVVVEVPGMGDDVQAIKAGILEIADLLVVNKADREGADQMLRHLRAMLQLSEQFREHWEPPILKVVAMREEGIEPLIDSIGAHHTHMLQGGWLAAREQRRAERELRAAVQEAALARALAQASQSWPNLITRIAARELDPYTAAGQLLNQ